MIDHLPTDRLPTAHERRLWQFDLAKRIVRGGEEAAQQLTKQAAEAVSQAGVDLDVRDEPENQ